MDVPDSVYVGIITVFFIISLGGMALLGAPEETAAAVNATEQLIDGATSDASQPVDRWTTVCLGSGCIPPVNTPRYVSAGEAGWLEPGDQVLAVSVDGRHIAFPLHILRFHSVINTRIGGTPVAATYSPYSGVPAAFDRSVGERTLTFEHAGRLYNGNMVMADTETGTRWSQFTGTALSGNLAGTRLQRLDAHIARWGIWEENYPDGAVLTRETGVFPSSRYLDRPYFEYHRSREVPVTTDDVAVHPKRVVYGVVAGGDAAAYRSAHLRAENIIQSTVGGTPVLVVQDEERDRFLAFNRSVRGSVLSFTLLNGTLHDTGTGTTWSMDGEAVAGPMTGTALQRLQLTRSYWYTWKLFHPETQLYRSQG